VSNATQILEFLYQGSYGDSLRERKNHVLGITHILNVKDSMRFEENKVIASLHVSMSDYGDTDLRKVLPACFNFIEKARENHGKVLVHCRSGQNRSTTVVVAYLTFVHGLTLRESWHLVSQRRPIVTITEQYWRQLESLEKQLKNVSTFSVDEIKREIQEALSKLES